jgi:hypothetical protein
MEGFPPPRESVVNLANWQEPPFIRWSFQHLREVIPTQRIARGIAPRPLEHADDPLAVADVAVTRLESGRSTLGAVLADTWTDAVLIMHNGRGRTRTLRRGDELRHATPVDVGVQIHRRLRRRHPSRAGPA